MARAFLFYIILSFTSCLLFTGYGVKGKIKSDTWRLIDFKRYIAMSTILFFIILGFALYIHNANILLPKQNNLPFCGRALRSLLAQKVSLFLAFAKVSAPVSPANFYKSFCPRSCQGHSLRGQISLINCEL